jgi:hypothetical protein
MPGGKALAVATFVATLAVVAGLATTAAGSAGAAQFRRCSPVAGKAPSGGFDRATVLVVAGKLDCEKSRLQIFKALSATRYEGRQIAGWTCSSTARAGSGHLYGATCTREGDEREAVRSTVPRPCHSCSSTRD